MRNVCLLLVFLGCIQSSITFSQISHGGTPIFFDDAIVKKSNSLLRNSKELNFIEMPSFDLDLVLQEDKLNEQNMRGSFQFAHKFYTDIRKDRDGDLTILDDGTKIWRIGIKSEGAYSLNLFFEDFEIPAGGRLFIYNTDFSYVIGGFDYRNNSPNKVLPMQPVAGDTIIVEYSEPANVDFEGNFTITEVNHDYLDFLRIGRRPDIDHPSAYDCMPDVLCGDVAEEQIRSTVLLIIRGNTACSGTLVNNTENDGAPYVLTAVHCLDTNLPEDDGQHYKTRAETAIVFFNYNRSVCGTKMKGPEELSLAESTPRVIIPKKDIALLEFREKPPVYYNAYYSGWNVDGQNTNAPYVNLHHPSAAVKKYGFTSQSISLVTYPSAQLNFDKDSHWKVNSYDIGATYGGSSGSPLFDNKGLLVGGLSGGSSNCKGSVNDGGSDYFFALHKGWDSEKLSNQLKTYLDPAGKGATRQDGMDPNSGNPLTRLSNADYNGGDELVTDELQSPNSGFVFGNSNLRTVEFAEEFNVDKTIELLGTYLFIPRMPYAYTSGVEISIYSGTSSPEILLHSQEFAPKTLAYTPPATNGAELEEKETDKASTESFVLFNETIKLTGKFFISYRIKYTESAQFCVFNTAFKGNKQNTAWLKDETKGWVRASDYSPYPVRTSLAIHALTREYKGNAIENIAKTDKNSFYYDRQNRILTFKDTESKPGTIEIYSVNGQLLEKIHFSRERTSFVLSEKSKGTIGIVRVVTPDNFYSGKIIY